MRRSEILFGDKNSPILLIRDALFRRNSKSKEYIFKKPINNFSIHDPSTIGKPSLWAVMGSMKSDFLRVASNQFQAVPNNSRAYPKFAKAFSYDRIQLLDFRDQSGLPKVHLSARYESLAQNDEAMAQENVNSTISYITGSNNYNNRTSVDMYYINDLLKLFNLEHLSDRWISKLSNGQMRRSRIAKALARKPNLLIIDDPFLGLDPEATKLVSESLHKVSQRYDIAIVLGLRVQENIPHWINDLAYIDNEGKYCAGNKRGILPQIREFAKDTVELHEKRSLVHRQKDLREISNDSIYVEDPHIKFENASVVYKGSPVLTNFSWTIPRGSNWRISGPNGTGKTTILSLITADHPQSWRSVLSVDGKLRKTGNGSSFFEVNNKIGISSPELNAMVPGSKTMKHVILSGLKQDVGNANFVRTVPEERIDDFASSILYQYKDHLSVFGDTPFSQLPVSEQKLALFIRAIIKNPDILILDEAFSTMDDESLILRCHKLIEDQLKHTTILAIGHIDWEVPHYDYLVKLHGDEDKTYSLYKYV